MDTFISILRGINVSGHNKIPMEELRILYEDMGFKNVTSYIQSGNVVFKSAKNPGNKIRKKILEKFGFDVPIVIRTAEELGSVIKKNPLVKEKDINIEKLHVTFLADVPGKDNLVKIKEYNYEPEKFIISGKEVYLYIPDSYGNGKLNNAFFENKLKVTATTRNWRTVNELFKIVESINK
jgi:uncharacterized protein (DUF1697 family)